MLFNFAPAVDLSDPIEIIDEGIDIELQWRSVDNSCNVNFDQYLWVLEDDDAPPLDHPRGFGVFGRLGGGPDDRNFMDFFASLGLGARGVMRSRPHDQFGAGFYYLGISNAFKSWAQDFDEILDLFPSGRIPDEKGVEAYYNFALTPAAHLAIDFQYLIDPMFGTEDAVVMGGRITLNF